MQLANILNKLEFLCVLKEFYDFTVRHAYCKLSLNHGVNKSIS